MVSEKDVLIREVARLELENQDLKNKLRIAEEECFRLFEENHYLNYRIHLMERHADIG